MTIKEKERNNAARFVLCTDKQTRHDRIMAGLRELSQEIQDLTRLNLIIRIVGYDLQLIVIQL